MRSSEIGGVQNIHRQFFTGSGIAGQNRRALVDGEAGMPEAIEDFEGRGIDFLQAQKLLEQLMAKEQHQLMRIGSGQREERTFGEENAIGHYGVAVRVPIGYMIAVSVNADDHAGNGSRILAGGLQHLPNGGIGAGTQEAQETTIEAKVLSEQLGDGENKLAVGSIGQDLNVQPVGKGGHPLGVA